MRNETPYLWGIEPDQTRLTYGAFRGWKDRLSTGSPPPRQLCRGGVLDFRRCCDLPNLPGPRRQ